MLSYKIKDSVCQWHVSNRTYDANAFIKLYIEFMAQLLSDDFLEPCDLSYNLTSS